mgnify:CR=1 FL=1
MVKFSVKKPLTVFVAVLAVLVLGVVAYLKMTPDLLPNMDFPYVVIVTTDPGASPEAVESAVTRPMEQSMSTLDRIKSVTSTSQDSVSMVVLEFEDGVNMDTVSVDIQQKINMLEGNWDDGVGTPYVLKINPSMLPVEVAAVSMEGMDTVELKGKGYELFVQTGDHVQKGQLLFQRKAVGLNKVSHSHSPFSSGMGLMRSRTTYRLPFWIRARTTTSPSSRALWILTFLVPTYLCRWEVGRAVAPSEVLCWCSFSNSVQPFSTVLFAVPIKS